MTICDVFSFNEPIIHALCDVVAFAHFFFFLKNLIYTTAPKMANSTMIMHNNINLFVAILKQEERNQELGHDEVFI